MLPSFLWEELRHPHGLFHFCGGPSTTMICSTAHWCNHSGRTSFTPVVSFQNLDLVIFAERDGDRWESRWRPRGDWVECLASSRSNLGGEGIVDLVTCCWNTFEDFPFLCTIAHLHLAVVTALELEERWC